MIFAVSTSHPDASYRFKTIGLLFQEKKRKIEFQDDGHLRFPIQTFLSYFYLQVILMLPNKFHVKWPFVSVEEVKNRFSRWWS